MRFEIKVINVSGFNDLEPDCQSSKFPNLISRQLFRLYGQEF